MEIEINIDEEIVERCVIYEGDSAEKLSKHMAKKYNLNEEERQAIIEQLERNLN